MGIRDSDQTGLAPASKRTGSLKRRITGVAAVWISVILFGGGFALDRLLTRLISGNFDSQLEFVLNSTISSAEIDPEGQIRFNRALADQQFLEPYSGLYWQVSGGPFEPFRSRSLWDRALEVGDAHRDVQVHTYDSYEFPDEPIRVVERDVTLPMSDVRWRFQVAQSREMMDAQIRDVRRILIWSLTVLGAGLLILAVLQTIFGLWPLRQVRREVASVRSGERTRITEAFPSEIVPLADEINQLLAHIEAQAEEARRHAGNLAHALKTPLTVITNAAAARAPDLAETVCRETTLMRRQVDHHLARARALGRRTSSQARATVWASVEAVQRAINRLYEYDGVTVDIDGDPKAQARVERQDLDEMIGNLVENAAKYGGGRVFITVEPEDSAVDILVEDDGPGIPEAKRNAIFARGARLDVEKPGAGLGLAIVRDVAEIYGGRISLEESEDLGGLLARLTLPRG